MVESITDKIYRIGVPLPGNPLRELNTYFIRGGERDLLIDTGFRRRECYDALTEGLRFLGADREKTDILLTHLHSDHTGLAADIAGEHSRVYLGERDLAAMKAHLQSVRSPLIRYDFLKEGFPEHLLMENARNNPAMRERLRVVDDRFHPLGDGDILHVGDFDLKTILVPGHTPGNCMFWMEKQGIMITGDHILFTITPNITSWQEMPDALGSYLASLLRVRNYPVDLPLPGHRESGNYGERIDTLIRHHMRRLAETEQIIRNHPGCSGYEVAGNLTWHIRARNWEEFPLTQKYFAMGECMAHLDYLVLRGKIRRDENDGLRRYYPEEET